MMKLAAGEYPSDGKTLASRDKAREVRQEKAIRLRREATTKARAGAFRDPTINKQKVVFVIVLKVFEGSATSCLSTVAPVRLTTR